MDLTQLNTRVLMLNRLSCIMLVCALAVTWGGAGCSGNDRSPDQELQNALTKAEQLFDNGKVIEARNNLLGSLQAAGGAWKGKDAAAAYRLLGDLSRRAAQLDSAIAFYSLAEESYRGRAQRQEAFQMELAIVELYHLMQLDDEARLRAAEALRLASVFGDSVSVTEIRWTLLGLSNIIQSPAETDRLAATLRATCLQSHDTRGVARIPYLLGTEDVRCGALNAAIDNLLQSVALAGKAQDTVLMTRSMVLLASAFERTGRLREAQESYTTVLHQRTAFAAEPGLEFHALMAIGNFSLRNQKPDVALTYYTTAANLARTMSNVLGEAYALIQQGHCQELAHGTETAELYRRGFELLKKTGHARGTAYALVSLGRLAESRNEISDAAQFYRAAVKAQGTAYACRQTTDLWLDCEEAALGRGGADAFSSIVGLFLQQGKTDDAFWYQEQGNARALSDDLSSWGAKSSIPAAEIPLQDYAHARALHAGAETILEQLASCADGTPRLLAEVGAELSRLEERMNAQSEYARHADPRFEAVVHADGLTIAEVQHVLDDDAVLLQYMPTPRSMFVCAVTPTHSSVFMAAATRERVEDLCQTYLRECARRVTSADSARAIVPGLDPQMQEVTRALYEALLLPVEPVLKRAAQLVVVFPRGLPAIPLSGLRRGGSPAVPVVGERFAVRYLPAARFALHKAFAPAVIRTVTGLGVRGSTPWDAEYELRDIHAFYRDAVLLFGKEATIASLRPLQTDVLHLAVELRFRVRPLVAGTIVLGDGVTLDGSEPEPLASIFSLPPIPAVVLSNLSGNVPSCDRAIAAAFLADGAASVIANATPMTRKAKKVFGEGFYTALQSGASVPAALRSAQVSMAKTKELAAPCFWAPLMLWGDGEREGKKK